MRESNTLQGNQNGVSGAVEKLARFEHASESILKRRTPEQRKESLEDLRAAAEELREHLAANPAPKEMAEWRELPDSNEEVVAFGYALRMEHADLHRELGDLASEIDAYERALDRQEAVMLIAATAKALAARVARHLGGEKAQWGRFSA